jgi:hypothetical protein
MRSKPRPSVPITIFTTVRLVLRTAPGAPRDLRALVNGHDVTLTWTNVGGASHFVLEVGLVSRRLDTRIFLGPDPRVTFANVPPGGTTCG